VTLVLVVYTGLHSSHLSMSGRAIFDTVAQLRKDRGGGRLVNFNQLNL
jgi:hypothetical protein